MTTNAVQVRQLRKRYGGRAVLDGVSFDIRPGETFALLGPNGAGKSTTVEILEGFRSRDGGEVSVLGADPARAGLAWKARIGVVLQTTGQAGSVTVREQLRHYAGFFPRPRDVDEVIEAVGLTAQAHTRLAKLSGGQQRRVDVALGIVGSPELLFLDEPTTGFDPVARRAFWRLIHSLKHDGTTILLTTHFLDEAAELADRLGIIADGRMRAIGTAAEIGGAEAQLPIVRWVEDGAVREERTPTPLGVARALAARLGDEPAGLEIVRPSLEDVYLGLVERFAASDSAASDSNGGDLR